jgi:hypothetical protein
LLHTVERPTSIKTLIAISPDGSNASIMIADAHRFPEVGVQWFWHLVPRQ